MKQLYNSLLDIARTYYIAASWPCDLSRQVNQVNSQVKFTYIFITNNKQVNWFLICYEFAINKTPKKFDHYLQQFEFVCSF